jgi:hypothetical protein
MCIETFRWLQGVIEKQGRRLALFFYFPIPVFSVRPFVNFLTSPGKMTLIFAFRQGLRVRMGKLSGEKCLDSRAFGGLWERGIPAIFWQTEQFKGVFSTGTENRELSGFSGIDRSTKKGKGARIGRICPQGPDPLFHMPPTEDK